MIRLNPVMMVVVSTSETSAGFYGKKFEITIIFILSAVRT
jgi:hypothetical protein